MSIILMNNNNKYNNNTKKSIVQYIILCAQKAKHRFNYQNAIHVVCKHKAGGEAIRNLPTVLLPKQLTTHYFFTRS